LNVTVAGQKVATDTNEQSIAPSIRVGPVAAQEVVALSAITEGIVPAFRTED
jgi:hypothetical protein